MLGDDRSLPLPYLSAIFALLRPSRLLLAPYICLWVVPRLAPVWNLKTKWRRLPYCGEFL